MHRWGLEARYCFVLRACMYACINALLFVCPQIDLYYPLDLLEGVCAPVNPIYGAVQAHFLQTGLHSC